MYIHPYVTYRTHVLESEERDRAIDRRRIALERAHQSAPRGPSRVGTLWARVAHRGPRRARGTLLMPR